MGFFGKKHLAGDQGEKAPASFIGVQREDYEYLRRRFFESYDRSLIEYLASSRSIEAHDRIHPIGEGRHFRALVLMPDNSTKIPLVISLPKSSFLGNDPAKTSARWCDAMKDLRRLRVPMIPPFDLLENANVLRCFVSPFGSGGSDQAKARWQPIKNHVNLTERALADHGFRIDDRIQVRCFEGIPFICDLSDLIRIKKD
jgi:hypothetical protein